MTHPLLVDRPVILKEFEIRCDNCDKKIGVMVCTSNEYPKNVAIFSCNKCKPPDMKWLEIVYDVEKQNTTVTSGIVGVKHE